MNDLIQAAVSFARARDDAALARLRDFLRIPSISAQPDHDKDVLAAAEFFADGLRQAGMENVRLVTVMDGRPPLILGEWLHAGDDAPTVLLYGHVDVQPEGELAKWTVTGPFDPVVHDGAVYARGACDDKGQIEVIRRALEACFRANGGLPVNIKCLFECEEEHGSVAINAFVSDPQNHAWLKADVALVCDSEMTGLNKPGVSVSLRGLVYKEVIVRGPAADLHSGQYGGAVENPGNVLCEIVAALRDRTTRRVLIPGFYDGIPPRDPALVAAVGQFFDDPGAVLKETGSPRLLHEEGPALTWAKALDPTLDINGMVSGYTGKGASTIIPASASAKVSMRLVCGQDHSRVSAAFDEYVRSLVPDTVSVEIISHHSGEPWAIPLDHPVVIAASEAMSATFGEPSRPIFCGGSIPIVLRFQRELGLPSALLGLSVPGSNLHGPNEFFPVDHFHRGVEVLVRFFYGVAAAHARAAA